MSVNYNSSNGIDCLLSLMGQRVVQFVSYRKLSLIKSLVNVMSRLNASESRVSFGAQLCTRKCRLLFHSSLQNQKTKMNKGKQYILTATGAFHLINASGESIRDNWQDLGRWERCWTSGKSDLFPGKGYIGVGWPITEAWTAFP